MKNAIFGDLVFDVMWEKNENINMFGVSYMITVDVQAYYEKDGVTKEQEHAYSNFLSSKDIILKSASELLQQFAGPKAAARFTPRTLLFQRNGECALLLDDVKDTDGGVAVILTKPQKVVYQDEYL